MSEEKNENKMSKKQKIIISVLAAILLVISLGAFWDLYGKNFSYNCSKQSTALSTDSNAANVTNGTTANSESLTNSKGGQKGSKQGSKGGAASVGTSSANSSVSSAVYDSCINKTKDNPQCKDCCDCLSGADSATRTSCRNTCATHDFSANSNFITVTAPSVLGRNGDYSSALTQSTVKECKTYCENSMGLECGDYQHCRMACDNKWGVQPGPGGQQQ